MVFIGVHGKFASSRGFIHVESKHRGCTGRPERLQTGPRTAPLLAAAAACATSKEPALVRGRSCAAAAFASQTGPAPRSHAGFVML